MPLIPDKIRCVPDEIIEGHNADCKNKKVLVLEDVAAAVKELREKIEEIHKEIKVNEGSIFDELSEYTQGKVVVTEGIKQIINAVFGAEGK